MHANVAGSGKRTSTYVLGLCHYFGFWLASTSCWHLAGIWLAYVLVHTF
jgi:hypothetical protein